jgi:hypothetical protein
MKRLMIPIILVAAALMPTTALAYVGPGAGLSLLGALWALLAAVGTALLFVAAWPVRSMLRRRRAMRPAAGLEGAGGAGNPGVRQGSPER